MDDDFDNLIDRTGTNCLKYDFKRERGVPEDVLPLWVADMDFQAAPPILERLNKILQHGIFGYTDAKDDYYEAVAHWYTVNFGWEPERRWIVKTPGVVFALAMAVNAYTDPGDSVLIQEPVYYPFRMVIEDNARRVINNPLQYIDGRYEIDFDDFEQKIVRNEVKLFILCSPHNPVGRVWTESELRRMEQICRQHEVIVVSDEIHSDFIWEGRRHCNLLALDESYAENTIVCTAPSKSFNLAGLQCSNIFIPDNALRRKFKRVMNSTGYCEMNPFGLAACQAAYEEGGPWLDAARKYIYENILFMERYLQENIPQLHMIRPEGTYLVWVDFRELGLDEAARKDFLYHSAKLWLDTGGMFGEDGEGFERFNAACPRATLERALTQLKNAVDGLDAWKAEHLTADELTEDIVPENEGNTN